jgi:hypothetical protein
MRSLSTGPDQRVGSAETCELFVSSSSIRKLNLVEKITDGRLLNMLVETKMKLAVAEEEKVSIAIMCARLLYSGNTSAYSILRVPPSRPKHGSLTNKLIRLGHYWYLLMYVALCPVQLVLEHLMRRTHCGNKNIQARLAEHSVSWR